MENPRIGVSLSGGGYRAAAFHLGTLQALDKLHILPRIGVLSTISGGSITGAAYAKSDKSWPDFQKEMTDLISTKNLIRSALLSFTGLKTAVFFCAFLGFAFWLLYTPNPWIFLVVIFIMVWLFLRFQFQIFPISKEIEKLYARYFTKNSTLGELKNNFELVIGSTNLQTARPFIFSGNFMGDSAYEFYDDPVLFNPLQFPLARAVMASSCVPFAFSPVSIDKSFFKNKDQFSLVQPVIVDGGVYDNQGIHKIEHTGRYACDVVIASDAGNKISFSGKYQNMFQIAIRSMEVFITRIKNAQLVDDVYNNINLGKKEVAYLSLGWNAEDSIPGFIKNLQQGNILSSVIAAHELKPEWIMSPAIFTDAITEHLKLRINYNQLDIPSK